MSDSGWRSASSIPLPASEEQRQQAEAIGMMVIHGIKGIIDGERFSALPCGHQIVIQSPDDGSMWRIEVRRES